MRQAHQTVQRGTFSSWKIHSSHAAPPLDTMKLKEWVSSTFMEWKAFESNNEIPSTWKPPAKSWIA